MDRILLVEDDESLALGIAFSLENENFEVKVAGSVKEAYDCFVQESFRLLLLDVMLPDGSGFDLCRRIRMASDVPIIFLTACDEEVNVVRGLDTGADDYITKPFKVMELVSRIRAALRRVPGNTGMDKQFLSSGNIRIFPLETRVTRNDVETSLTPVEFRLLSLFIQNPLRTLTREQILQKLWDIDGEFINDNALSVFVRRLREKLEDDPSNPEYIITVRGSGYKWNQRSF